MKNPSRNFCIASAAIAIGLFLSACNQPVETPASDTPNTVNLKAAAPGTPLGVSVDIFVPQQILNHDGYPRTDISGAGNPDTCNGGNGYRFMRVANQVVTPHALGVAVGGTPNIRCVDTIAEHFFHVSFEAMANFVQATSGNINLNFQTCGTEDGEADSVPIPCEVQTFIQYLKNKDWSTGAGVLLGTGEDGTPWTIDLSQVNYAGNAFVPSWSVQGLTAHEVGGDERTGFGNLIWY